jgi:hypothetical protein
MNKSVKHLASFFLAAAFLVLAIASGNSGSEKTNEKRTSISQYEAKAVAEGQVKTLLKSPSTAKFSGLRDTKIEPIVDGHKVTGYVDSQNSFGATIRTSYSVEIYLDKDSGDIMYKNLKTE